MKYCIKSANIYNIKVKISCRRTITIVQSDHLDAISMREIDFAENT